MLDDSNIYQLNLTEKEWEFWHLVSHAGTVMMTAIIAGMTNSEDNVEALARLTQRYAALIREDPDIIVRLLGKIKAADSTARQLKIQEESPVAPLSIVVQKRQFSSISLLSPLQFSLITPRLLLLV
jgi:hypothetical protein